MSDTRMMWLLGLALGGWLLYLLAPILTPFVAAALLAYLGDPLVDRLQRLRLSRTVSVVFAFVLIVLVLGALGLLIVPLVTEQGAAFASKLPTYVSWVEAQFLPRVLNLLGLESGDLGAGLGEVLSKYGDRLAGLAPGALGTVTRSGGALLTTLVNIFLIPVLTFYLLRDYDRIVARCGELVPARARDAVTTLARESDDALGGFLRGQILVMLGLATIYSIGLSLLGLDYALAIGVLAGVVSFVPYLGLVVGIVLAGLSALAQLQSWLPVAGVVVVFVVGQMIEGTLLTPRLVGDRIGLHPVVVIFAVMAGGQLFGFFGILLALPGAAVVSVIVRHVYGHFGAGNDDAGDDEVGQIIVSVLDGIGREADGDDRGDDGERS